MCAHDLTDIYTLSCQILCTHDISITCNLYTSNLCVYVCNGYNMGTRDLPDYMPKPEGHRHEGMGIYIRCPCYNH